MIKNRTATILITNKITEKWKREQWRNDGVAAAPSDGGPNSLEFLIINFNV